jgi:hypothetical protein
MSSGGSRGGHTSKLPKFDFPRFEVDHPKLWIKQAVHYFELYRVESVVWVKLPLCIFMARQNVGSLQLRIS